MKKKGQIWVSVILYTLIATMAVVLILQGGLPILNKLRDRATFEKMRDVMVTLDKNIVEVINEGAGSQRKVAIELKEGKVVVADDTIFWEFTTDNEIMAPRTSTVLGNLIISSNSNVHTIDNGTYYILQNTIENDTFKVKINKIGSEDNWEPINTSGLIEYVSLNNERMDGKFNFSLNGDPDSTWGYGYTQLVPAGNNSNLGRAKIVAHINTTSVYEYDLEIILESYADFIVAKIRNFESR